MCSGGARACFGIAIGPVQDEVEGDIHQLFPGEELAGVVEAGAT